jgi:hypothetical protein
MLPVGISAFFGLLMLVYGLQGRVNWILSALGVLCLVLAAYLWLFVNAARAANASLAAIVRGETGAAKAMLDDLERRLAGRLMGWPVAAQRAMIAWNDADLPAARAASERLVARSARGLQRDLARGQRAVVCAAQGEVGVAREDIDAVRATAQDGVTGLPNAMLAEALLLAASGEYAALGVLLRKEQPLAEHLVPRERALLRALGRAAAARATGGIYREPARGAGATFGEGGVAEWIARIAPSAAAYVDAPAGTVTPGTAPWEQPPAATPAAVAAVKAARAAARKGQPRHLLQFAAWVVVLSLVLLALSYGIFSLDPAHWDLALLVSAALGAVALVGAVVRIAFRARRQNNALTRARALVGRGGSEEAAVLLEPLRSAHAAQIGAPACALLALLAEQRGDFATMLALCDEGLVHVERGLAHPEVVVDIAPVLLAERAFALAALGREDESEAELANLVRDHSEYLYRDPALFSARLMAAVARQDLARAAAIARARTPDLLLDGRCELLADVVLAAEGGAAPGTREALAGWPEGARWVTQVAPQAVAAVVHGG